MKQFSVSGKNWILKNFDSSDVTKYLENFAVTEIVAKLLSIRKKNIGDINQFLDPKIKNILPNPFLLKDMKIAVERTYESILNKEVIGIRKGHIKELLSKEKCEIPEYNSFS